MKHIDDREIEALIGASFERQEQLQAVSDAVMSEIRSTARKELWRKWGRLAALAFGIPFVLLCFFLGTYYVFAHVQLQPAMAIGLLLSAVSMVLLAAKVVKNISIHEV